MQNDTPEQRVLQELAQWRLQGAALRQKLMAERETLAMRLKEIDKALGEIPDSGQRQFPGTVEPAPTIESTPDIVRFVISQHPDGMGAAEIIQAAQAIKPELEATLIHSAIYRLWKAEILARVGKRGGYTYRLRRQVVAEESPRDSISMVRALKRQHPRKGQVDPDSLMGQAIRVLGTVGKPTHVDQIAAKIEAATEKPVNKTSLIGALARAAKKGPVICRDSKPNTFGLTEWRHSPHLRQRDENRSITTENRWHGATQGRMGI